MKFPDHKSALYLTHNDHLNCYQTVAQFIENEEHGYRNWVSEEQKEKAMATNDCWFLQWYSDSPCGFCLLAAADIDVLLDAACHH